MAVAYLQPKDYVLTVPQSACSSESDALAYTRWLATHHYENFQVVSFLLPKHLHQDFYNVYSFCRWADDLGDEIGDTRESLRLLAWWRTELEAMYAGQTSHPVFVALKSTVDKFQIPIEPFDLLIRAFIQDQDRHPLRQYGRRLRVLRQLRQPGGPSGPLPRRLS